MPIYDQTCAIEKRRRRKRGMIVDPARCVFIDDAVCEGCGDCSVESNCLSAEPLETELGMKRKISQSSCNKDFSCVNGFHPSFVTAEGAQVRKSKLHSASMEGLSLLPYPELPTIQCAYGVLVTGMDGTGMVMIEDLLGMAAHVEGEGMTVLDMAGLAQKGGAVLSHVQIDERPGLIRATCIAMGEADLVISCDAIVSASDEVLSKVQHGQTRIIIDNTASSTADFIRNLNQRFPGSPTEADIRAVTGDVCAFEDASTLVVCLLGDAVYTNPLVLSFVWQKGWVPLTHDAFVRTIELNGVTVEKNRTAFKWGRHLAQDRGVVPKLAGNAPYAKADVTTLPSLGTLIAHRVDLLTAYRNAAYAAESRAVAERVHTTETAVVSTGQPLALIEAVVCNLSKLMVYKDEYEVARPCTDPVFLDRLRAQFEGEPGRDYQLNFWLTPPIAVRRDEKGHLVKQRFGPNMMHIFKILAKLKGLHGTAFDILSKTEERRAEHALISEYHAPVGELAKGLTAQKLAQTVELTRLPEDIRGFGHMKEADPVAVCIHWSKLMAQWCDPAVAQQATWSAPSVRRRQ